MTYKAAGNPCELWSENVKLNPASFSTVAGKESDDWRWAASIGSTPARPTHTPDTTAYSTQPPEDSWYARRCGTLSPAKVASGSTGTTRGGQIT